MQIRVKVVEARQLMGEDLNPLCRIKYDGNCAQTKIQKGTNSPWFNDLFFFHKKDVFPEDLLASIIKLTVSILIINFYIEKLQKLFYMKKTNTHIVI